MWNSQSIFMATLSLADIFIVFNGTVILLMIVKILLVRWESLALTATVPAFLKSRWPGRPKGHWLGWDRCGRWIQNNEALVGTLTHYTWVPWRIPLDTYVCLDGYLWIPLDIWLVYTHGYIWYKTVMNCLDTNICQAGPRVKTINPEWIPWMIYSDTTGHQQNISVWYIDT